ncbi:MAG TPA: PrsW family glutamic-type intramembrane protease [Puia sp.]|jgi:RsiW-degrading membrane proteinase PrsW (M82 family)|nr:PrsW family glutamic-type intramembrane protease [Puia sp.]
MFLFALAIAPGIAVCLFIYSLNKYGRGSMRYLVISFILGMLATVPALFAQLIFEDVRTEPSQHSIAAYIFYAFVVVALSEEGSKFFVLRLYAYPQQFFREPFDGVIYAVMIGMGFATVENIEYVHKFGLATGVSRFFLAIPAHAAFAVLMGYPVGRAKFARRRSVLLLLKGLLVAVLFHGSFDFFLFIQQKKEATTYLSTGVLSFGAFATFYIAVRLAMRALRMHRAGDNPSYNYNQTENDR